MTGNSRYRTLLSPIDIGSVTIPNRVAKAPQDTHFVGPDGRVESRVIALYEALARGGVGLIFLASVPPIQTAPEARQIGIWSDEFVPGLAAVADAVRAHGSRIFLQLNHGGPAEGDHYPRGRAWAPSTLEMHELPSPQPHFKPVRGLSVEEIERVEQQHIDAAERAFRAGYHGVEVHAAHTYLLGSFLTRIWNRRDDHYGFENVHDRTRIVTNIIRGIHQRLGDTYPVGVRINGEEWGAEGTLTVEEAVENARALDEAGACYVSVSGYGHGPVPFKYVPDYWRYPEPCDDMRDYVRRAERVGLLIPAATAIKAAVSIPVIGVGRLRPDQAERLLRRGKIDMAAMGRSLWADTDLVNKLAAGSPEDIRPCTFCATCEVSPRRCRVNAALGTEDAYELTPAAKPKKVMVVGGGPGGMEAARVAASRGHRVVLYEKERKLGGLLPLAVMVKGTETEDILGLVRYMKTQMSKLGVELRLGTPATPRIIQKESPDVLVWATGGAYQHPDIPGIDSRKVLTAEQLRRRAKWPLHLLGPRILHRLSRLYLPVGRRVIVIGGRIEGVETAEFLIKAGRRVAIVDTAEDLGQGMPERLLTRLLRWFEEKQVSIHTGIREYSGIDDRGLHLVTRDGARESIAADTIVIALPQVPDGSMDLDGFAPEVYRVEPRPDGTPWLIVDAVAAGFRAGFSV